MDLKSRKFLVLKISDMMMMHRTPIKTGKRNMVRYILVQLLQNTSRYSSGKSRMESHEMEVVRESEKHDDEWESKQRMIGKGKIESTSRGTRVVLKPILSEAFSSLQ